MPFNMALSKQASVNSQINPYELNIVFIGFAIAFVS